MAIASSLLENIYIAYALGADANGKMEYAEPIQIKAQIEKKTSTVMRDDAGLYPNYDMLVSIPYNEKTQFIDEQTLLWINVEPNINKSNSDYIIGRVGKIENGNLPLYCNSTTINTKPLYYEYNGKIYQTKVDFDQNTLIALIPFNKYLPIVESTKVWTTKPNNIASTKNLIQLIKKERLDKAYRFIFKSVEEQ